MKNTTDLIARIFLSTIFFYEAADTFWYFNDAKDILVEYGLDFYPRIILIFGIGMLVLGALLVLIGYLSTFGAFLLLLYIIPYTFIIYSFWNDPPATQRMHALMFMKNIAIIGGLLLLMVNGAGKYSIKRLIYVMKLPK
jgi:putative oxidoreductase